MSDPTIISDFQRAANEAVAGLTDLLVYAVEQMDHAKKLIDNGLDDEARDLLASTSDALSRCRAISDARRVRS